MKQYFAFQWHITDQCDQRCRHCYIFSEDNRKKPDAMTWPQMEETFYNCLDFCEMYDWLPYFYITGGDPILHPDFRLLGMTITPLKCVLRRFGGFYIVIKGEGHIVSFPPLKIVFVGLCVKGVVFFCAAKKSPPLSLGNTAQKTCKTERVDVK